MSGASKAVRHNPGTTAPRPPAPPTGRRQAHQRRTVPAPPGQALAHLHHRTRRLVTSNTLADSRSCLADLQAGRCFYCRKPFRRAPDADHFIPRVRCGIDAVENLVLADSACNNDKRDLLPASPLVDAWADRNFEHEGALVQLASSCGWDSDAPGTLAVARSIYRHLPPGQLAFWLGTGRVDITHVRPGIVIDIA